jgi:cephalosporin hydroxylase
MYCLDIGTAKGFSAICAATAGASAGRIGVVHTVDVIPPESRAARNAPTDLVFTRPTLPELIADMATGKMPGWEIHSYCDTGIGFLNTIPDHIRIDFAFVDGKHRHDVVHAELSAIAAHQRRDDVIVVDDVQLAEVHAGLKAFLGTPAGACYRARTMHGGFKVIGVLERVV